MAEKNATDPAFEALLNHIQESRGLDFRGYKRTSLQRRILLRMENVGIAEFADYQAHLEAQPGEFEDLLNTVLINVTSFFRDAEAWEALKTEVIPAIIESASHDRAIRVWSVGCASGEEPYSIAMLLAERMGHRDFHRRVKIYATDLDEEALRTARQATYSSREVESVPADLLAKYFERTNNHYVFNRDLRKCVIFGGHNVVRDAPISRIDLIVCRNLLIYLEAETQDVVLPRLHYALRPDGFLFLGKAETQLARSTLFRPVDPRHRIFAKVVQEWRRTSAKAVTAGDATAEVPVSQGRLMEAVLNEAGTAFLVVDENGMVALANYPARQLLGVGEADIGKPFQDLPISYRPLELRGPIEDVLREQKSVRLENQEYHRSATDIVRLTIDVRPLFRGGAGSLAALLSFSDTTRMFAMQRELAAAQESLEQTIEELQSANEELETTNEELQSTNEELETTNEELQSINEELETINEESRSSNEEMESVNEELRIQASEATNYRDYLESVLRSLNVGVVVLDDRFRVASWNRWNENVWGLRSEEVVGTEFGALSIGIPLQLLRDGLNGVQIGERSQHEQVLEGIDRRGRKIIVQVRVVRLNSERNSGLVLAFEDLTEERRGEEFIHYLGRITGRALNEIYFLEPETLRFILVNKGGEQKLGVPMDELRHISLADVLSPEAVLDLQPLIASLVSGDRPEVVFETRMRPVRGESYPAELCLQYFADESPPILVSMVHDISERVVLGTG
jgi:two-component system CheB/CheR fusion protein